MKNSNKYTVITEQHVIIKSGLNNADFTTSQINTVKGKLIQWFNDLIRKLKTRKSIVFKSLFVIIAICSTTFTFAQTVQDKINKTNYDLYRANNTIQSTTNAVNGTVKATDQSVSTIKDGASKVIGWLSSGKKEEESNTAPTKSAENKQTPAQPKTEQQISADASNFKTTVTINNCDFNTLREFANSLNGNPNIKSIDKSYNNNIASIILTHTGNTDSILDFVGSKFPNRFSILTLQTGIINLALK